MGSLPDEIMSHCDSDIFSLLQKQIFITLARNTQTWSFKCQINLSQIPEFDRVQLSPSKLKKIRKKF